MFHKRNIILLAVMLLPASIRGADFEREVQPLLTQKCGKCHGPNLQESNFRIDSPQSLLKGGDWDQPAIVPGNLPKSFLYQVVAGAVPDLTMPPEKSGPPLSADELAIIKSWIESGAAMPVSEPDDRQHALEHWSFRPVLRSQPPTLADGELLPPIDAFIRNRLKEAQLNPSPQAERHELIRRLYLVMLGLPPTPEQVAAFMSDQRPDAWEHLIDEVLDSPHYGERWARHWLDLVRFGETHGFETNRERPNAWRYRDWVIAAFNQDLPYDEFVRHQIVGDACNDPIATGFLVAGPHDLVKSPDINLTLMQRQDELTDLVNATGTAFLGLTLGCARCHNHKFDPISQRDFYALQAVFGGVEHGDRPLPMPPEQVTQLAAVDRDLATLQGQLKPFLRKPASTEGLRPPVNSRLNTEQFPAAKAKVVRFTVLATNGGQPCIDELALFAGDSQVGLKSQGATARCSSALPGYEIHKLEHIHDGQYGNSHSWISNENGAGWIEVELPEVTAIDRIEWGRDREEKYRDRVATKYRIDVSVEPDQWQTVASSDDRAPFGEQTDEKPEYVFTGQPEELARQGQQWLDQMRKLEQQRSSLATPPMAYAGTFRQPETTYRLYRGEPQARREEVSPDTIAVLGQLAIAPNAPEQERRKALADWIASRENPLTARVIVNRLWQFHFGTGIVPTPSDFGHNGVPPIHPELLDWLASELMDHGWSLKHVHRQILLSKTWQQSSTPNAEAMRADGACRFLWRYPPRRLEAEAIRDCMLAVSGKLDVSAGGPGFSGFEVELENVRHFHPKTKYGPEDWRRMIYMTKVRQEQDSVFGLFDCPDASQVAPVRSRSTTPLQALNLLNSTFVLEQSEFLAARLQHDAGEKPENQISLAWNLCFNRNPTVDELAEATAFAQDAGLAQLCRALLNSNEFLFLP